MSVSEIVESMGIRLATVSQHLRALRNQHVVKTRKDGQKVYYSLSDPRLIQACTMIRDVLVDGMKRRGLAAQGIDATNLVQED
jgi:ArsR family transcriptional regulator